VTASARWLVAVLLIALAAFAAGCGDDDKKQTEVKTVTETTTTPAPTTEETGPASPEAAETEALFEGVAMNGVELGDPDAPVTLYEFADLQCPFCKEFNEGTFPQIVEEYVKDGRVKVVFRNLTFLGPDSVTAARAAAAAGLQNKLWPFVDLFYKNQGPENSGYVTDAFIAQIAEQAGADPEKLAEDMSAPVVEQQLGEAQSEQQKYKVNSTPSFLIQVGDGKPKPLGNQGTEFDEMSQLIDEALAGS
jgi:protein-disulfide isomerase